MICLDVHSGVAKTRSAAVFRRWLSDRHPGRLFFLFFSLSPGCQFSSLCHGASLLFLMCLHLIDCCFFFVLVSRVCIIIISCERLSEFIALVSVCICYCVFFCVCCPLSECLSFYSILCLLSEPALFPIESVRDLSFFCLCRSVLRLLCFCFFGSFRVFVLFFNYWSLLGPSNCMSAQRVGSESRTGHNLAHSPSKLSHTPCADVTLTCHWTCLLRCSELITFHQVCSLFLSR